ncbi:S66 family peptidase [Longispora albida]|uniref:S66 family peptidase n=1 Tax=Longispora albida TaxID=203523 RepID=UPI00037EC81D|nr:S66 peptidase family protein [Longispora albida]
MVTESPSARVYPPKPKPGDRVAIVSPSTGRLPHTFPHVHELGIARLRDELGLVPVEYPTTRDPHASPADRARDLHAAFADPEITAILSVIGGDDQITVLKHLDAGLLRANPKPFFGYSDNTNLLAFLWQAGVVGFHGGSIMVHLGRGGATHPVSMASLRAALFEPGWYELPEPAAFSDQPGSWADVAALGTEPVARPSAGWSWHQPADRVIEAPAWGGCLEIVAWLAMADVAMPAPGDVDGHVLFLETSEEMPGAGEVFRTLRNLGERGLLGRFSALLMGRPKAWHIRNQTTLAERESFAAEQRGAVLEAMAAYNPDATIVFDLDLGHTDPQVIIPFGGLVRIDGQARTIAVQY